MKRSLLRLMITALALSAVIATIPGQGLGVASAVESGWKVEFDAVCGQTDNAMNMSVVELKKALEKCDAMGKVIDTLEPTPRKIYLKRLQMCRNLFSYMLENRLKDDRK